MGSRTQQSIPSLNPAGIGPVSDDNAEADRLDEAMAALDPNGPASARLFRKAPEGIRDDSGVLVILDASFNPMTTAHEQLVEAASLVQPADEILLLLSTANVDKGLFGATLGQRMTTLLAYADGAKGISVGGCSHAKFVDKVAALRDLYPAGTAFEFIIGHDTLLRLFEPTYYEDMDRELQDLFANAGFLVANRNHHGIEAIRSFLNKPEYGPYAHRLRPVRLAGTYATMSSTQVRQALAEGRPISGRVPSSVKDTIESLGLYRRG